MRLLLTAVLLIAAVGVVLLPWPVGDRPSPDGAGGANAERSVRHLRFAHNITADSALHEAALRYAEQVRERSGGRIEIAVHPNQELGTDHQMIEMARAGELDLLITPTAKMSALVPPLQYADLPFLFPTPEDAHALLDGEPGRLLLKALEPYGLVGAAFWENGFKQFTANRPIEEPEDFRGLNIRIMKSRIIREQFLALGANPIPIDFHETRQALADGVVDGEENPLVAIVNMGFHEVQSDLTLSNHAYLPYVFVISAELYRSLPPADRDLLVTVARELAPWERAETARREARFLRTVREAGVRVHTLDRAQRARFEARTRHVIDAHRALIGPEIVDRTRAWLAAKYGPAEKADEIVIGLSADLSLAGAEAGEAIRRGIALAVEEINAAGGLLGRSLTIMVKDDAGIPARGLANIEAFAGVPNLAAVVGGKRSPVVAAQLDAIHRHRIVYLIPWAAAASLVDNGHSPNFVFRLSANSDLSGRFVVEYALGEGERVGLLLENSLWGRSNQRAMRALLAERGLEPVAVEWFNAGDGDLSPQLSRVRAAGAEVLLLVGDPAEAVVAVRSMARREHRIPIVANWGLVGGDFWRESREPLSRVELAFFQSASFLIPGNPVRDALAKAYLRDFGLTEAGEIFSPTGTLHAYDLVRLLAEAVRRAGKVDGDAIRRALEGLGPYRGASAELERPFTPERHEALDGSGYLMARFDAEGRIVPLAARADRGAGD